MLITLTRLMMLSFAFVLGLPSALALDFDREIARQRKTVKVKYKRAPKSIAHFMHQYTQCKPFYGLKRSRCNVDEAKRHYNAYRVRWDEKQRQQAAMTTGDFQISLERKDKSGPSEL